MTARRTAPVHIAEGGGGVDADQIVGILGPV